MPSDASSNWISMEPGEDHKGGLTEKNDVVVACIYNLNRMITYITVELTSIRNQTAKT